MQSGKKEFEIGDVVVLKSNFTGPMDHMKMTIEGVSDDLKQTIHCVWFTCDFEIKRASFPFGTLQFISTPKGFH